MKGNKWIIIACAILLLFLILNPTATDFKDFKGAKNYYSFKKKYNFLVYSVYEDKDDREYVGLLKNFFEINKQQYSEEIKTDSASVVPDSVLRLEWEKREFIKAAKKIEICNNEQAERDLRYHMNFYYPDWKMSKKVTVAKQGDCSFQIQFYATDPHINKSEVFVAKVSYYDNYTNVTIDFIRGVLY